MAVKDEENGRQRRRRFGFMRCSPRPREGGRTRRTGSSRSTITSAGRRDSSLSSQRSSKGGRTHDRQRPDCQKRPPSRRLSLIHLTRPSTLDSPSPLLLRASASDDRSDRSNWRTEAAKEGSRPFEEGSPTTCSLPLANRRRLPFERVCSVKGRPLRRTRELWRKEEGHVGRRMRVRWTLRVNS
jgi:hypothetical protein